MKSIERQMIINRLVYRLCPDMIPIIKSFCFETQVNANLVVVSRTVKRWLMNDLDQMDTWRTLNGAEWVVGFSVSVYGGKALSYPRYMEIGATNCGKCGGYVASLVDHETMDYETRYCPRIVCDCPFHADGDELESQVEEEDYDF